MLSVYYYSDICCYVCIRYNFMQLHKLPNRINIAYSVIVLEISSAYKKYNKLYVCIVSYIIQ